MYAHMQASYETVRRYAATLVAREEYNKVSKNKRNGKLTFLLAAAFQTLVDHSRMIIDIIAS